jgi:hypothetical protein
MLEQLIADVEQLVKEGELRFTDGNRLVKQLSLARFFLENDRPQRAIHFLNLFIADVERLVRIGRLDPVHGFELVGKARAIIVAMGHPPVTSAIYSDRYWPVVPYLPQLAVESHLNRVEMR